MTRIAYSIYRVLLCLFLPYLFIAIPQWELNPAHWQVWLRWVWVFMFVVFVHSTPTYKEAFKDKP